ncbi:glycosyltransferase [Flavobacterium saliperosum S13]|uniref:Glycosyltransferase involved in cell wall bisynthesis n=2 Tax=Flavobacterium saliperosum TaxID=329186 RepID=A0A1G4VPR6_9FLAO|nr:glycosyltransferase [Flavobacterium saliperosum]ESU23907.1 glycosyltransferase [Flavobacterium saliperosum S13]SCX09972.1 Glycosyltransferase involved in cell wall bisynthesis [Flavobacterium saliperosum]
MRILQLIDSLEAGGAERMAVNYANALVSRTEISALVVSRKEGALRESLFEAVPYLFLNRTKVIDLKALWKLRKFVVQNNIEWLHAHGTSFFMAVLLKLVYPKLKIVWHDHNGNRVKMKGHDNRMLIVCSYFFNRVLVVNEELKVWATRHLKCNQVLYLPNFTVVNNKERGQTLLKGISGKRIVCLANLRHPKNHITLLEAFHTSGLAASGWTLHLIGKDSLDAYSEELKVYIKENSLPESVFVYGGRNDIFPILQQATIGVLVSTYEGFPVTLLEYGLSGLAVIASDVGYCSEIINGTENGLLFDPKETAQLREKLVVLAENEGLRKEFGAALAATIAKRFSEQTVIADFLHFIH